MSTTITFRRGTTTQIDAITPTSGEPVWETDGLKLAIGDGSTSGGLHIMMGTASDYITKALFGAHSIIMAVSDDTPIKLDIAASRIVGRKASGNIAAMTGVETIALLTGANLDVGAYDVRGQTITADALTSGRVVFAGGSGVLSDSTNMTFATDTLTVAKLGAFEATGAINFGNQAMTNVDINSGAIDGTNVTVGSGKTLNLSSGTLTLDADQISGDKVEGGTINAITINTLTLGTAVTGADKPYSDFGDMTAHAGSIIKSGSTNANTLLLAANDTTFITLTTGETDTMQFGAFTLAGTVAGGSQNVAGLGTLGCGALTTTDTTTIDTGLTGVIRADSGVLSVDTTLDADSVDAVEAAGLVLADTKVIQHDPTPGASHTANGEVVSMTCAAVVTGDELVFGDACYIDTSGTMQRALADDAAVTIPATHLCIATIAENAAGLFLTRGWAHDDSWTFDVGLSVYLDKDTPGLITKTMPTKVTGNQVQVLGTCLVADTIYWNPSLIVVEYA